MTGNLTTGQKQLQELEQRASTRAQEAHLLPRRFMAIVSHNLRGPLSAITTSATLLQRKLAKLPIEAGARERLGARQIEVILRAARQLDRRIEEFIDVSSVETGCLKLELAGHDLGGLVRESVALGEAAIGSSALRLIKNIPERALVLSCDRRRLLQALSNLIDNAIRFTPAGGTIVISVEIESDYVRVSVQDSGVGIAPGDLLQIFDRFKRPDEANGRGSGLGLTLARGVIEAHGGKLTATSVVGKGSTFSFVLPVAGASC